MSDQNGIRKAAVFLNGLDWETASTLLKRLPPEESRAIRREMVAVEGISPTEINKTVRQFLKDTKYDQGGVSKKKATPQADHPHKTVFSGDGVDLVELSGQAQSQVQSQVQNAECRMQSGENQIQSQSAERRAQSQDQSQSQSAEIRDQSGEDENHSAFCTLHSAFPRRFEYLERRSAFETAGFLAEESEQLIAVVLSQLTPRYSGDVLACFEQSLKRDLIRRLARLDATDETILDEIDEVLKDRLKREVEERPKTRPGLALLEQILQVVDSELGGEFGNDITGDIISGLNEVEQEEQQAEQQAAYYDQYEGYGNVWNQVPLTQQRMHCDHYTPGNDADYINTCTAYFMPPAQQDAIEMLADDELAAMFRPLDHETVVNTLLPCDPYFTERVLGLFPVYEQVNLRSRLQASGFRLQG